MTGNQYQELAMRTMKEGMTPENLLVEGCLGLAGESGEVCDIIKKHIFQGHSLDTHHLIEELGDVMWYIALTAKSIGCSLDGIMEHNINKLKERYPNGFNETDSINRTE